MDNNSSANSKKPTRTYDKKVHGKRLSNDTKLAIKARLELGHSATQIAKDNGLHTTTVSNVKKDRLWNDVSILSKQELDAIKRTLIGKSYQNSLLAQNTVDQKKLDNSSFVQLMVGSKISLEIARLGEGLSTSNVSHSGVIENLDSQRQQIIDRINAVDVDPIE